MHSCLPEVTLDSDARACLSRSRARRLVLRCLVQGTPANIRTLSQRTGLSPASVAGALRGSKDEFLVPRSLLANGFVVESQGAEGNLYTSTPRGALMLDKLCEVQRHTAARALMREF